MSITDVDKAAHERFLTSFLLAQPSLRSYLQSLVGEGADCDDIVQEVSLILWREFANYDPERPFIAWAIGIARNQVALYRRQSAVQRRRFNPQAEAALSIAFVELEDEFREQRLVLKNCLERLGPQAHELLCLRYQLGKELAVIAVERASSVNAVNKALGKIRRLLLDCTGRAGAAL